MADDGIARKDNEEKKKSRYTLTSRLFVKSTNGFCPPAALRDRRLSSLYLPHYHTDNQCTDSYRISISFTQQKEIRDTWGRIKVKINQRQ